jgi:hypothetical protein
MRVEKNVSFEEVRAAFLKENAIGFGSNEWAFNALEMANKQFGNWVRGTLTPKDILGIMLPHHYHYEHELVPKLCSSVSGAIEKVESIPESHPCRKRIEELSGRVTSPVFLSIAPITHPDYKGLTDRDYRGLTHLDGLHRLIAWGRTGRAGVVAYVAGMSLPPADGESD